MNLELNDVHFAISLLYFHNEQWQALRPSESQPNLWISDESIQAELHLDKSGDELDFELSFEAEFETQVRLRLTVLDETEYFHLIPGNIHGDNNATHVKAGQFPLLAERSEEDVFRSPLWEFRADRASLPVSMLCFERGAVGISIQPFIDAPDGSFVRNGVFAELPNHCGVSLGYRNDPVTYILNQQWEEPTFHQATHLRAKGKILAFCGEGRAEAHKIVRRIYNLMHEAPVHHRTYAEAARGLAEAFVQVNWSDHYGNYTDCKCHLPAEPELKPWRSVAEIGWSGGMVLAYPLLMAQHLLELPEDFFAGCKSPAQICDEIIARYNPQSGFLNDVIEPIPEWPESQVNGWWSGYLVQDCHCAYTNGNAAFYLLKSIDFLRSQDLPYPESWLSTTLQVLDTAISLQREDGAFGYTFSIEEPKVLDWEGFAGCWFAAALPLAYRLSGDRKYLDAAARALDFYAQDVRALTCSGTPMDTWKSIDEEGNLAFVRASRLMHEITGKARYLDMLDAGAHYEYLWRCGFRARPEMPPLKDSGWNSVGASLTSVSNPHLHPMGLIITSDLEYLAAQTGDAYHAQRASDGMAWALQSMELYPDVTGYGRYGVIAERFCPSDGLLIERYTDGTPSSLWFAYNAWAAANILSAVTETMLESKQPAK